MSGPENRSSDANAEVTDLAFDRGRTRPPLADKADDLDALRTAVVDAAGVSGALWLSYLFVLFYFLVAAGGVTHEDLFFERPVKLPFLNVDLPLKGFFWLAPIIFLIVHAYVLLHFVVLADKIRVFDTALVSQIGAVDTRASLRRQLPTNIFVQFLAGPRELRLGIVGALLWLIAAISLVAGPILVLLFFELQFLPYHEEWITWLQRAVVALDLGLIWGLWPSIVAREKVDDTTSTFGQTWAALWTPSRERRVWFAVSILVTIGVPVLTTFPGEALDGLFRDENGNVTTPVLGWVRRGLVEGEVDPAARRPISLWSNRLVLPGLDVIDHTKLDTDEKIEALPVTASLRRRHLEAAVLIGAILRKADFTGAYLQGARLNYADLRQSKFECAEWFGLKIYQEPICTHLEKASLNNASLQGASLRGVVLRGASLEAASLQGASLVGASLQGAFLDGASLQGASLVGASLQGAFLPDASMQGASLDAASLQGASLDRASLQGAYLAKASLQGASLNEALLQGASLAGAFVWRANAKGANTENLNVLDIHTSHDFFCTDSPGIDVCDWTTKSYQDLRTLIETEVPEGSARIAALQRIESTLNPDKPLDEEQKIETQWRSWRDAPAAWAAIEAERALQWRTAGCNAAGAPYVVARMTPRLQVVFTKDSQRPAALAAAFLDPACEGARGISAQTIADLKRVTRNERAAPDPLSPP